MSWIKGLLASRQAKKLEPSEALWESEQALEDFSPFWTSKLSKLSVGSVQQKRSRSRSSNGSGYRGESPPRKVRNTELSATNSPEECSKSTEGKYYRWNSPSVGGLTIP